MLGCNTPPFCALHENACITNFVLFYHFDLGGDCGTVQTSSASLNSTIGSSVDLTCTYTVSPGDRVYSGSIAWQSKKPESSTYENIALFSPPGGGNNSFTTTESAMNLKDRAELLNVTSTNSNTFRVVIRVKEVQCLDEKEYRCFVSFNNPNTGPQTDTAIIFLTIQGKNQLFPIVCNTIIKLRLLKMHEYLK